MRQFLLFLALLSTFSSQLSAQSSKLSTYSPPSGGRGGRHYGVQDGLLNNQVRQLVSLPGHQIFVATEGAFFLFNGKRFVEQPCRQDSIMTLKEFGRHDYMMQGDSLLWLKDFYHIYMYDVRRHCFRYDYAERIKQTEIKDFLKREKTTQHDLLEAYRDTLLQLPDEHSTCKLWAICKDWQGGEWYGLESDGILYRRPTQAMARAIDLSQPQKGTNLSVSQPSPLGGVGGGFATPQPALEYHQICALSDNQLLLAGFHGAALYDRKQGTTTPLQDGSKEFASMHKDANGGVWLAAQQGLFYYKDGTLQSFSTDSATGFRHSHIRFAIPLADRRLLVCNILNLLGYLDLSTMHFDCLNDRLPELSKYRVMIDAIPYDNKGTWMIITQNGLFLLNTNTDKISELPEAQRISHFTSKFNCALHDSQGRIWLGTQNGLFWLVPQLSEGGVVKSYTLHRTTTADGLTNNCIRSLIEDTRGNIWVGTSYGVNALMLTANGLRIVPLLKEDGVPNVEVAERGLCLTSDGQLHFVSSRGLTCIDSRSLKGSNVTFITHLLAMRVRGENMPLPVEPQDLTTSKPYHLAYDDFPLEMEFSALNYDTPEHTLYRYRLGGLNSEWQTDDSRKGMLSIVFNTLPPGSYRMEVQAKLDNGEWGPIHGLDLVVSPPWWLTWWAITLYVVVGLLLLSFVLMHYLRYRRRQLERENEAKINKFFELQSEAKHNFAQHVLQQGSKNDQTTNLPNTQSELAERMNRCIADNMDNIDYTVDQLARDLCMSRASLYKKAQEELGITPNDFMRNVRLKHSITLLEKGLPVNQVALMVGFQTPYYFSKCFKKMFGVNPSQFQKEPT